MNYGSHKAEDLGRQAAELRRKLNAAEVDARQAVKVADAARARAIELRNELGRCLAAFHERIGVELRAGGICILDERLPEPVAVPDEVPAPITNAERRS